jgi:hypothetical protein
VRSARALGILTCALLASSAPFAGAQEGPETPSLSSTRVALQVTAGTVAAPLAFFGVGYAAKRTAQRMGASDEGASRAGYIGAYTATWLATAAVPAAIGRDGNFGAALGGSALGLLASAGVVRAGNWLYDKDRRACGPLCWALGGVVVALPSAGATILYNRSRR